MKLAAVFGGDYGVAISDALTGLGPLPEPPPTTSPDRRRDRLERIVAWFRDEL